MADSRPKLTRDDLVSLERYHAERASFRERVLAHKDPKMSVEEAQAQLAMSIAQLSALERLRKNLKH